jgi:hypothetical protein
MPGVHASLDHIATAVVIVRIVVAVRDVSVVVIRVEAEAEAATEVATAPPSANLFGSAALEIES